jgi:L-fuculose-phosphate aldolase
MLYQKGFVAGTDGNLSVRLSQSRVMVTPSGMSKGMMCPSDMAIVNMQGDQLCGKRPASSEIQMHLTIYKMRADVNAIVHAHPCTATAFASTGVRLDERLSPEIIMTLGKVPLAPYKTPGTQALSDALAPFILEHNAILMANHGVVAYGTDLRRAYLNMETVEQFAKTSLIAILVGQFQLLKEDEVRNLHAVRAKYNALNFHEQL